MLEHAQYTRPREFRGHAVPEILLSGDHQRIRQWRLEQSLIRTRQRRSDLLNKQQFDKQDTNKADPSGNDGDAEPGSQGTG